MSKNLGAHSLLSEGTTTAPEPSDRPDPLPLLLQALEAGATSLHFEPRRGGRLLVRARIAGSLTRFRLSGGFEAARLLAERLRAMAGLADEKTLPQSERALITWRGAEVPLQISTLPSRHGEVMAVEVVDAVGAPSSLRATGLGPSDRLRVERALEVGGLILAAGPARAGKRTFLNACLRVLAGGSRTVYSIAQGEADLNLDGVVQVELHEDCHLRRAPALRCVRFMDTDAVRLDRLDSPELLELAVQMAVRGYTFLSSVDALDAAGAVLDLLGQGIEPYRLTQALSLVVGTRLPHRLCPECRDVCSAPGPEDLQRLAPRLVEERLLVGWELAFQARGCSACAGTGHQGRVGLFEVLPLDAVLIQRVRAAESPQAARQILQERTRSLREQALLLASQGEISVVEALRSTPVAPEASSQNHLRASVA